MGEKEKTNDSHDVRLKELFKNKEAFLSLLKDCVKAEWIKDLDEDSLKPSNHSFILQDFRKKEADVVYEATLKNGKTKVVFYVLLELQRKVDYRMPYRLLLYIVEILRYYYNNADAKARKRKNFKFPAVFPIIFFNGGQKWSVPLSLKEMFDGYKIFGDSLINFNYALVDAKGYDEESVKDFQSKLLKVMMMFEKSRKFGEILEITKKYNKDIAGLNEEEYRIINAAFDILSRLHGHSESYNLNEIVKPKSARRADSMLSDILANPKKYIKEYDDQIKKEAKKEMNIEIAREMLLDGEPIFKIMKYSKLTEKEIRAIEETL